MNNYNQPQGNYNNYNRGSSYNNNNGYGKDSARTGLIIALTSVIFATIAVTVILIVVLVKQKNENKEDKTTNTQTEITTEITTEATTTEAPTEASTETPGVTPYAEANCFTWTDPYTPFELPSFSFLMDANDSSVMPADVVEVVPHPAQYTIGNITRSEPDASGYVTITIPYTVNYTNEYTLKADVYGWGIVSYQYLTISDYYTGTTIKLPQLSRPDMDSIQPAETTNIDWNGQSIPITFQAFNCIPSYGEEAIETRDNDEYHYRTNSDSLEYILYVPSDYDGLVISIQRDGYTDAYYNAAKVDSTNSPVLGPDSKGYTYTPDQLIFMKVSDNIR